jgi:uncharacterized membrane protein
LNADSAFQLGPIVLAIDVISRIVHVLTAITLVGGSVFTLWVLMPSLWSLAESERANFATALSHRWKRFVHGGIALFLITGFYNYFRAIGLHKGDGLYHALMGIKMLLALAVFFFAAALVGRSAKLESMRQNRSTWLSVLVVLAVVIVAISGLLKVRGIPVL